MLEFYQDILIDLDALELASYFLRQISLVSSEINSLDLFELLKQSLHNLNLNSSNPDKKQFIAVYFQINLSRICGEELNMFFDRDNQRLRADYTYDWDDFDKVLVKNPTGSGNIDQNVIKVLRLILTTPLSVVLKIQNIHQYLPSTL